MTTGALPPPIPEQFDYLVYLQEVFVETDVVITPDELIYHYGGPTYVSNLAGLLNDTDPRIVGESCRIVGERCRIVGLSRNVRILWPL